MPLCPGGPSGQERHTRQVFLASLQLCSRKAELTGAKKKVARPLSLTALSHGGGSAVRLLLSVLFKLEIPTCLFFVLLRPSLLHLHPHFFIHTQMGDMGFVLRWDTCLVLSTSKDGGRSSGTPAADRAHAVQGAAPVHRAARVSRPGNRRPTDPPTDRSTD